MSFYLSKYSPIFSDSERRDLKATIVALRADFSAHARNDNGSDGQGYGRQFINTLYSLYARPARNSFFKHMQLPQDNFILLSFINTKLRDEYSSLEDFCNENDLSPDDICGRMAKAGYEYDRKSNSFREV